MSHKKPKNRSFSSKNEAKDKSKDKISELKNKDGLSYSACKVDHDHDHSCNYEATQKEPFSFAQKSAKHEQTAKDPQSKAIPNPLKPDLINDLMKSFDNNFNFSSNIVGNNVGSTQAATKLIQEMLVDTSSYLSSSLKDNMNIGKDFVACKDVKDIINFQNNLFKANFSNMLDYTIKIGSLMQSFVVDQVNVSSDWFNRNSKIVTNP